MTEHECPICGSTDFAVRQNKRFLQCSGCGSLPRNRSAWLLLQASCTLDGGARIAHFAPERGIASRLHALCGAGYERYDFVPGRYAVAGLPDARKLDLCTDLGRLPKGAYRAVMHNHVMEHLPCNYTIVLQRLHDLLEPGGVHIFSIPLTAGHSRSDLDPGLSSGERNTRFGQFDHMRKFGAADFDRTVGMIFGIEGATYALTDHLDERTLLRAAIPPETWRLPGSTVFIVRK